ncbi:Noc2 domain-containing protein [Cephalotus follicularis]|uniref:Noc2 domain-containing protein n=1 Tax=Cephalotus follicularis TaxID=3775 RepID=A0A1Q3C033_CEPFO|nr:Noc2 domain-containing protein [Cephalotus follicularis]
MGKLGKKARKFAKKNLQSVYKRNRKLNSKFKRKASKRGDQGADEKEEETIAVTNGRIAEHEDASLEAVFSEDENDVLDDQSESDGYLSEDSDRACVWENECENILKDNGGGSTLSVQNREIQSELAEKRNKLNRLKEKDPEFSKFLESYNKSLAPSTNEDTVNEDDTSNDGMQLLDDGGSNLSQRKLLTCSAINSLCEQVTKQQNISALISLLNEYRAACHYGTESSDYYDAGSCSGAQYGERFCKIIMFILREADNIFRGILGIPCSNYRKETILQLNNSAKWKNLKPLIKLYLRSTLFLLNQITDTKILFFSLTRIRASIVFFVAFPHLLRRLIKIAVHLWATGEGTPSLLSSLILQDVTSVFSSDCFDTCLIKMYKAFVAHSKFAEPVLFKHIQFMRNSFVELCSQDVQKSSRKAMVYIQHLAKILQLSLRTRKKEAVKKICSLQYTNCIDLWLTFISVNIQDKDLQPLFYRITQIINGMALLFPGPRYLPLKVKCIQWLNQISISSGIFIPVASFALDFLEYKTSEGGKPGKDFSNPSNIKLPKYWLKSLNFREECVSSTIELLAMHFSQWSYHISFPELATIPLICLRKFHELTTTESLRRLVKRFIDQVEQNVEFVKKNREDVAYSPKDQQSVDSFLQLERCSGNTSFTQYYKSIIEKATSRQMVRNGKISFQKKSKRTKRQTPNEMVNVGINGEGDSDKGKADLSIDDQTIENKEKKMRM